MPAFVLEIGTEELPARFLSATERELKERFAANLEGAGLSFSGMTVYSTPRRQIVYIADLSETSAIREEVVTGPSIKAAYDVGGRPTRAAEGFARTHGISLDEAFTIKTDKGEYIAVKKNSGGESAYVILEQICPTIISSLPFPKRMRWTEGDTAFARPVRWILVLLGDKVIEFNYADLVSGRMTHGHRVHGPGPFPIATASDFIPTIRDSGKVVCSSKERREIVIEQGNKLAMEQGGSVLWKDSLLDEVEGLCEWPVPILGGFNPSYLEVPREVLLTSMEKHQKSFGLAREDGSLLPYFLTVSNITPKDVDIVKKGWERVLRARLEDARFFWETDLASGMEPWLKGLDTVIFLAPLGSMGNKTRRIEQLCGWLAENIITPDGAAINKTDAMRAGRLSKADLVSEMVKEFDTLQGIMGGIYAGRMGETENVAKAIQEQYLPAGPDTPVPATIYGAIVSMADKADTLVGCFGLGMIPTGTADPYGLRRAALGIARIAQSFGLRFDIKALFARAMEEYGQIEWKFLPEQALPRLEEFFALRLKNYFISSGAENLLVEACLQADASDVWAASARLDAITAFSKTDDFAQAVLTFKRAANIIRKQTQDHELELTGKYDPALLTDDAEKALAAEIERIRPVFEELWKTDRFADLFALLRDLRPFVDAFFEQVMVMCEDEALRMNRLNLLHALVSPMSRLADFAALQM